MTLTHDNFNKLLDARIVKMRAVLASKASEKAKCQYLHRP
jgi:hypothetical protein